MDRIIIKFSWLFGSISRIKYINEFDGLGYQAAKETLAKLDRLLIGDEIYLSSEKYRLLSFLRDKGAVSFEDYKEIDEPTEADLLFAEAEEWEKTLTDKEREYIAALGRRFIAFAG